jgi:thymidylate kinase
MDVDSAPKIIAICGVDGVGKSSIVEYMEQNHLIPGACYLHREKYSDGNLEHIKSYFPRRYNNHRDWRSGAYAKAAGTGIALDFVRYYQEQLDKAGGQDSIIVLDRYVACYLAYLKLLGCEDIMKPVFRAMHKPCMTFYISVDFDVLESRYANRASSDDDEDVELMIALDKEYKKLFATEKKPVLNINNSGNFSDTIVAIKQGLKKYSIM